MTSLPNKNCARINYFVKYLKYLKQFNDQWGDACLAKDFIYSTNDEVSQRFLLKLKDCQGKNVKKSAKEANIHKQSENFVEKKTKKQEIIKETPKSKSRGEDDAATLHTLSEYPFALKKNEALGRHLVSTKDILAGEIVLLETPLVMGPIVRQPFGKATPSCVYCYREASDYLCPECGFYVCRGRCRERHLEMEECAFLRKLELVKEQQHIHAMENRNFAEMISSCSEEEKPDSLKMIAKAYLNFVEEEKFRLMKYYPALPVLKTLEIITRSKAAASLVSSLHGEVDSTLQRYRVNQTTIVNTIQKLGVPYDDIFIHRIADIWDTNAFEMKLTHLPTQALFVAASLMTHSCKPNCEHNFSSNGVLVLRAVEDIPPNTILTLSYSDKIWPTYIRRDHLKLTKKFICNCQRCLDPTECGTFIGHVRCESCGQLSVSVEYGEELCSAITCTHCNCNIVAKEVKRCVSEYLCLPLCVSVWCVCVNVFIFYNIIRVVNCKWKCFQKIYLNCICCM